MMRDLYLGVGKQPDPGFGLTRLVSALSEISDLHVRETLEEAAEAALELDRLDPGDLDRPAKLAAFHGVLEELERLILTDVTSLLGVSIGFSDNDGDTG